MQYVSIALVLALYILGSPAEASTKKSQIWDCLRSHGTFGVVRSQDQVEILAGPFPSVPK